MIRIDQVIVVEGKYDRMALSRVVDGIVLETGGFAIFSDDAKLQTLRTLGRQKGLILLTDSDRSGMAIRNYIIGAVGAQYVRNAYIPDCFGKEKRKKHPSADGKLGVEAMSEEILSSILSFAVAPVGAQTDPITNADLYQAGLLGREKSAVRRAEYQEKLGLPAHLSPRKFLEVLNAMRTRSEFLRDAEEFCYEL